MVEGKSREIVTSSPLFMGLSTGHLSNILDAASEVEYTEGETIIKEGDESGDIFILISGVVCIEKKDKGLDDVKIIHSRKEGAIIGEMSLIDMKPRSASVRADTAVKMVLLNMEALSLLFDKDVKILATVALNIARTLSERLRESDEIVADFLTPNE